MRILILIAIALLLFIIVSNLLRRVKQSRLEDNSEKMVKCVVCGLHVAEHEAVEEDQHYFCCHDHLESYKKNK